MDITNAVSFRIAISAYERTQVEGIVLAYINDAYRHLYPWQPEPSISATDVLDYLLQHGRCPAELKYATRKRQQTWVRSLLGTSVNSGRLETSLGLSRYNGRRNEVRLYSPMTDLKGAL